MKKILREGFLLPVKFYRRFISPAFGPVCRYYPSCSAYALEAVRRHGIIIGFLLAGWRLLRCNPWSKGGVDKVPEEVIVFRKKNTR